MSIDIEETKRLLKCDIEYANISCLRKSDLDLEQLELTLKALEQQQARIKELEKDSEWISVDEDDPQIETYYDAVRLGCEDVYVLYYCEGEYWCEHYGHNEITNVTHFKQRPKPPEGEL